MTDAIAWSAGLAAAMVLRYDFDVPRATLGGLSAVILLAVALQIAIGFALRLYLGRARPGSFDEVAILGKVILAVTIAIFVLNRFPLDRPVPTSVPLGGGIAALTVCVAARYAARLVRERGRRPVGATVRGLIVFGAGEGGAGITTAMLRDPSSPYRPVALLDDDSAKRRLRIMGVSVVGTRSDIRAAAERFEADALLIAIPSANAQLIREVSALAADAGLEVRVLPPVAELLGGRIRLGDIRPLTEADLLGRHRVETHVASIAGYLTGRRVLVTGAGGSIGSELCRQIRRYDPRTLVMLDRDESALHALQLSIDGQAPMDSSDLVIANLRERERVFEVFERHQPEVVFHAAALKHVPLLELHPGEAVKTNLFGTHYVLEAAMASGVDRFVAISTDKAADPVNVLGYTKRIGERLTADAAVRTAKPYLSVRFGNVLGSRGSVLDTFRAQIDAGHPVTVTHPEVTRFFMSVEEAVELTIQAGAIGKAGETLVLDMGDPVRIAELAQRLIENAACPIDIVYTGLRPGEKLHESRLSADEEDVRRHHPLISHVQVEPLAPDALDGLDSVIGELELRHGLERLSALHLPSRSDNGDVEARAY